MRDILARRIFVSSNNVRRSYIFIFQTDFANFVLKLLLAVPGAFVRRLARQAQQLVDEHLGQRLRSDMRPVDIQHLGNELAVKWDDGSESFIPLEKLRRSCPCAGCKGEVDIMGHLHIGPEVALPPTAFELVRFTTVGTYAIQPVWADGHASGLFSFDYLRKVAEAVRGENSPKQDFAP